MLYTGIKEPNIIPEQDKPNQNNNNNGNSNNSKKINIETVENQILLYFDSGYPTLDNYENSFEKFEDSLSVPIPDIEEI